jgi:hypothetical protein
MFKQYKELERMVLNAKMDLQIAILKRDKFIAKGGPQDVKAQQYDTVHSQRAELPIEDYLIELGSIELEVVRERNFLELCQRQLNKFKIEIKQTYKKCNDLECKVFYMRHVENKSVNQIATELGYSFNRIRNVNQNINAKIKNEKLETPNIPNIPQENESRYILGT